MTKHGNYGIGGEKLGIFPQTLSTTTHYTVHLPQISPPLDQNPAPSSSIESLETPEIPNPVYHKAGFAKIGYASQSLITNNPKALFEGKSEGVRAFGGDSESLPRLMERGFERHDPS